jgi:hypothetical protein
MEILLSILISLSIGNVKIDNNWEFATEGTDQYNRLLDIANSREYRHLCQDEYKLAMEREARKIYEEMISQQH